MTERFACDNCGREWSRQQLKEVFRDSDGHEIKQQLCPECLDETMNAAAEVYGVSGDQKRAAAYVSDQPSQPPTEDASGRREGPAAGRS